MAEEDKLRTYLKRVTVDLADARAQLAEADARRYEPLAVIGMSCRYPGADDVESFWDLLAEGRGATLDDVPDGRFDLDPFVKDYGVYTKRGAFLRDIAGWDASFFGSPALEAMRMDPQQRMLLELTWEALEDAGTAPPSLRGSRTGMIVGFSDVFQYGQLQLGPDGAQAFTDPYTAQGSAASVVAGRLAYAFDLRGPAMVVDTACSSSLVAVHVAANALRSGECDLAVAAAASLVIKPQMYVNACAASMLSREGTCKTFDANADGYVMGEGGGVVVLERLSDALKAGRRIHAVIRATAVNQDGRSNGLTAPNRSAQVDVIRRALEAARLSPEEIDYVEAHGSGTKLGDAIELGALSDVFGGRSRRDPVLLGAVKTNIGHTQAAAGMAGLIKAALVLKHGVLPPNLNMAEPNGVLEGGILRPSAAAQQLSAVGRPHLAGVSSFGWAGTNAHAIVETAPAAAAQNPHADQPAAPQLLPVSAADPAALRAQLARLGDALGSALDGASFADVVYTLQTGRAALGRRRALTASTAAEAAGLLKQAAEANGDGVARVEGTARIAFLLPGVGDQYRGLGRGLYRDEPVFAAAVERCLAAASERCGVDLRPMFEQDGDAGSARPRPSADGGLAALLGRAAAPDAAEDPDFRAQTAHLFLFTVEYALARLLATRGVTPDLLIGYSLGEYVAACLAGVFELEDALWVVAQRARLVEAAPEGRMLAAAAGAEQIKAVVDAGDTGVDVAALNGPAMTVLSGTPEAIDALAARLAEHGVAARRLRSAHAFHSSLLAPARGQLAEVIARVRRNAPTTPIVSNVTGELLTAEQAVDPQYWAEHLCRPVRFADAARFAAAQGIDAFVELGAGQTLGGLLRQNTSPQAAAAVLGTLPAQWPLENRTDERAGMLETCGRLWELGADLDWNAIRTGGGRPISLPTYPFQRTRYWPPTGEDRAPAAGTTPTASDLCYVPVWQPDVVRRRGAGSFPAGPLAVFADADGAGSALADLAEASGAPVIEIVPGTEYRREGRRIAIDPMQVEHYREALGTLAAQGTGPVRVVHLWSLRDPAGTPVFASDDELRTAVRNGFDSVLLAIQALAQTAADRGVRLLTASAGCAEILGGDATAPDRALAHGLAHAVRAEYRGLTWHGVDLDPADSAADAAAHLAEELRRGPWEAGDPAAEPALAGWRRGRRWTKGWAPVALPEAADGDAGPWHPDGTYLITGGTRGLGLGLARHLVRRGVRRLALVGRTDLAGAARRDPDGPAADSLRAIAQLEEAGAEVLPLAADVGVPDELRRALRECREHFGALTGVVHAAGLPAGGLAERLTPAGAARVLGPKVAAMGPLAELVGPGTPPDQRPELLVLYSSAITVFGGLGEGDYSAANSVLDAYGAALAAAAPTTTRVLSVAWGPWQHDDWQGEGVGGEFAQRVRDYRKAYGFTDEEGCDFLDRLTAAAGTVVALRQPLPDGLREWATLTYLDALADAAAPAHGGARFPRPQLRAEYVAPRTDLESTVAESWGGYLGIDRVGVHDPFFDLGGNSLVGMAMVASLAERLGRRIAPAVLFEHPTVAAFAAALAAPDAKAPGTASPAPDAAPGASSARGARRRQARTAATATQNPRQHPEVED